LSLTGCLQKKSHRRGAKSAENYLQLSAFSAALRFKF
jgi:hypothetical protein